ncbi:hypothetical protein LIER_06722 [Lithospermum erythrorhizon]|uniref:Uncharacterized protein n=1 Tax=Lithospermum erythrorhizon TaxID=34254 RepID=A0AAV3P5L0_LITER
MRETNWRRSGEDGEAMAERMEKMLTLDIPIVVYLQEIYRFLLWLNLERRLTEKLYENVSVAHADELEMLRRYEWRSHRHCRTATNTIIFDSLVNG